jgi:hypothetical protein
VVNPALFRADQAGARGRIDGGRRSSEDLKPAVLQVGHQLKERPLIGRRHPQERGPAIGEIPQQSAASP